MNLIIISSLITTLGQFLLKLGMRSNSSFMSGGFSLSEVIKIFTQPLVFIGLVFFFLASIIWLKVLSGTNLSYAYPIVVAINFTLITSISILFLSESVSINKLVGIIGIFASIALMSI